MKPFLLLAVVVPAVLARPPRARVTNTLSLLPSGSPTVPLDSVPSAQHPDIQPRKRKTAHHTAGPKATSSPHTHPASSQAGACIVTDPANLTAAVGSCSNIVLRDLKMPTEVALDLRNLKPGAVVTFDGTTTFAHTPKQDFVPIVVSGQNITITGAPGHLIDGNGPLYWDGMGSNGGEEKCDHFFSVNQTSDSTISNLHIKNWPTHCFTITKSKYLSVHNLVLDNREGDAPNAKSGGKPAAHNSDGFGIARSDHVTLSDIQVYNQDDCVAVTSGTFITSKNMYCANGHGLSIGSIGNKEDNTVDNVVFEDSEIVDSSNALRIKTVSHKTGSVSNVHFRNITMKGISKYGVDIQQDYLNSGPTGKPTNGVAISGITFEDIKGDVKDGAYSYYVLCGSNSCSKLQFSNVAIAGGKTNCNAGDCPAS